MATYLPFSDVVAAYGYKPDSVASSRGSVLALAVAYVIVGGALGTVAGTSLAMASLHNSSPALVFHLDPKVEAGSVNTATAKAAAQPSTLNAAPAELKYVEPAQMTRPSPMHFAEASATTTHQLASALHPVAAVRPAALRTSSTIETSRPHVVPASTMTIAHSAVAAVAADAVAGTPVYLAPAMSTAKSSAFYSEGDVTVADFNATMGTIETYEGKTFSMGGTASAAASSALEDSGLSIHYRCDQAGNCSLYSAGKTMQNVRLM
jgi:hypothetical protein